MPGHSKRRAVKARGGEGEDYEDAVVRCAQKKPG